MLEIPDKAMFPQADWIDGIKQNGCGNCHQAGGPVMRSIDFAALGVTNKESQAAWAARLRMGQAGTAMLNGVNSLMTKDGGLLARLASWTDRIAAGELPAQKPARPEGIERNIVITLWDWSRPTAYLHDLIGTDRRKPTVNGRGPLYGAMELSTDWVPILDPVLHMATETKMPVRVASTPRSSAANVAPAPWRHWGDRAIWDTQVNAHTNMMDGEGRVWWSATHRPQWEQPAFCQKGSAHPSAKAFPLERASGPATNTSTFVQNARGVTMYDPKTKRWAFVDTCFGTHHLNFGFDADNTLYLGNNGGPQLGWVNTRVFLETGDSAKAQGWTPFIIDTNGNGRRDEYVEPVTPVDPRKDKRLNVGFYGIAVNQNDGTVWGSNTAGRGWIVRVDPGPNPPVTALTEAYQLPPTEFGIRGM
ncbi:MAG: carboxypeptidase regulatory-like domain-containing protein, partial [Gemmatimonadetes bacterium]|nr:carboxypeptidase regulatory-like domain-containing protein [Gemmatimonadota bacterium]